MKTACSVGQLFGGNNVAMYKNGGLLGHPGVDHSCGFGSTIKSEFEKEYVYKVLTKENPANDGSGFTGVFTIIDNGVEVFEFLYGHCDPVVKVGDILTKGTVIGTEANNGEVYSGGKRITLEMQKEGNKDGSHRHDQKRILRKDIIARHGETYLTGPDGNFFQKDGYFYCVPYAKNGYNGCVNWLLPLFNRDLFFGCTGHDVQCLQNFLKARGYLNIDETTQFFGKATMKAVSEFQKAHGISPTFGYVGTKTRKLINEILN